MSFAGVTASHLVSAIQYHSVKLSTLLLAKAEEIAGALLLRVLLEEIEAVQQDLGKGNWTVIFKTISTAKRLAENGFTLLNEQISPVLYNKRLITASVAVAPLGTMPTDIQTVLQEYTQFKQVHPIFLRDFPSIKSGKFRVVPRLNGEGTPEEVLPSFITLHGRHSSVFLRSHFTLSLLQLCRSPGMQLPSSRRSSVVSVLIGHVFGFSTEKGHSSRSRTSIVFLLVSFTSFCCGESVCEVCFAVFGLFFIV